MYLWKAVALFTTPGQYHDELKLRPFQSFGCSISTTPATHLTCNSNRKYKKSTIRTSTGKETSASEAWGGHHSSNIGNNP